MDHQHIQEHNLADRYVLGRLSLAERAQFEEHFVDCPECIQLLETAEKFRTGLRRVAAEQSTAYAVVGLLGWLARLSRGRQSAFLVVALLVMVLPTAVILIQLERTRGALREARST